MEDMKCNCDICEYGSSHDYRPNHYRCKKKIGTIEKTRNCSYGKISPSKLEFTQKLNNGRNEFPSIQEPKERLSWSDYNIYRPHPETSGDFSYSNPADNK